MNNSVIINTEELSVLCITATDSLLDDQSDNDCYVMNYISAHIRDLETYAVRKKIILNSLRNTRCCLVIQMISTSASSAAGGTVWIGQRLN